MIAARSDTAKLAWLAKSPPPITILVGEKTLLAPRAVARQLGPALAAATVVVSGAAHMIPITHPEALVAAVRRGQRGDHDRSNPPNRSRV
jgi:pimeloyl-ACP methyl ester carboxylesterase